MVPEDRILVTLYLFQKPSNPPSSPLWSGGKPTPQGEKEESFMEGIQKSSPPLEKGRTGGIYEPPFQKN